MAASTTHQRRLVVALVAALLCAGVAVLFMGRGPVAPEPVSAAPAAKHAAVSLVLAARRAGGHDALWLLSPADGTATAAGVLPGFAGSVAVAPDGQNVAYLPQSGAPHVWIGYGPLAPRDISLAAAGVKKVDGLTWITDDRLLVSGVTTGKYVNAYKDRLFVVTVSTGKVRSFRHLHGTEPSAAPGIAAVAYVHFTTLVPGTPKNQDTPLIRESVKLLRLARSGGGRTLASEQYRLFAAHRAFSEPMLAPAGEWLLTGGTGSDVRVTYELRDTEMGVPWLTVFSVSNQAGAWDPGGQRVAFGGAPAANTSLSEECVWVYDTSTGALTRTPTGVLNGQLIRELAWSADGRLVASSITPTTSGTARHNVVMLADDLGTVKDLGPGHAAVWVQ